MWELKRIGIEGVGVLGHFTQWVRRKQKKFWVWGLDLSWWKEQGD